MCGKMRLTDFSAFCYFFSLVCLLLFRLFFVSAISRKVYIRAYMEGCILYIEKTNRYSCCEQQVACSSEQLR